MISYPWYCFEQRASKAIALDYNDDWAGVMASLPAHLDRNGLIKYFPKMRYGSDILTSYILTVSHERGWEIPAHSKDVIMKALSGFVSGRAKVNGLFSDQFISIRKIGAIEALSRHDYATANMLDSLKIELSELPTSALIDMFNIARRIKGLDNQEFLKKETDRLLRARIRFDGPIMRFVNGDRDDLWYFMAGRSSNAVRIILSLIEFGEWKEDIPRFMQGAIGRQVRGHWGMTTANSYGTIAVNKFVNEFESEPIIGVTKATYGDLNHSFAWQKNDTLVNNLFPWKERVDEEILTLKHEGTGSPWATIQSVAAVSFKEALNAGYKISKKITPLRQKEDGKVSSGDMFRTTLEIEAMTGNTWVAVADFVPPGAVIMGKGLDGESVSAQQDEEYQGRRRFTFQEKAFDSIKTYYEYMPQGLYEIEYTYQVNTTGTFQIPEARVEAMYHPEVYGVTPNAEITIEE